MPSPLTTLSYKSSFTSMLINYGDGWSHRVVIRNWEGHIWAASNGDKVHSNLPSKCISYAALLKTLNFASNLSFLESELEVKCANVCLYKPLIKDKSPFSKICPLVEVITCLIKCFICISFSMIVKSMYRVLDILARRKNLLCETHMSVRYESYTPDA